MLTGLISGFFGGGGGMVLIPLLTALCKLDEKKAFASSICIILPISVVSIIVYAINGILVTEQLMPFLIGGIVGGVISGLTFKRLSAGLLQKTLGGIILWGSMRLLLK